MSEMAFDGGAAPLWKDRSTGLALFGILQILVGVACACALLASVAATEMAPRGGMPRSAITVNIFTYSALTLYFVSTGVGSIRKRRWARALSLVVGGWWLAIGVVSVVLTAITLPHLRVLIPPSRERLTLTILFAVLFVIYVAVPSLIYWFYSRPDVKSTVDAADPRIRWTDRVPPRVLGLIVLMATLAVTSLIATSYAVLPLFGVVLTGGPAILVSLAFAVLFAFLALQFYRMKKSAWVTLMLLQIVGIITAPITIARTNIYELYDKMGMLTPQTRAMKLDEIYRSPLLWAAMGACALALVVWTFSTRRYFDEPAVRTRAAD